MTDDISDDDPTDVKIRKLDHKHTRRITDVAERLDNIDYRVVRLDNKVTGHITDEDAYRAEQEYMHKAQLSTMEQVTQALEANSETIHALVAQSEVQLKEYKDYRDTMSPVENGVLWIRISGKAVLYGGATVAAIVAIYSGWEKFW